jgi:protoheme IX farnesyltransferase
MSLREIPLDLTRGRACRRTSDFIELTKPRVVLMVLVTASVGFYLGSGLQPDYVRLLETLLGTALAAGGTLALNQYLERDSDGLMERTRRRPLPDGRIEPAEALFFGVALVTSGLLFLLWKINDWSALITLSIVASYLFIYTPLKRRSSLCALVGAVPGALPPLIGWAAVQGEIRIEAWVLFAVLFLWQTPHTLAIARLYRDDFARAGIRFLPVVERDGKSMGRQVVGHTLALLAVSLLPTLLHFAGEIYFAAAFLLGAGFLAFGVVLARSPSEGAARRLVLASLIYLPLLLAVMALDRRAL